MLVDAESRKYLDDVRKGKPRKFVMVCNGVKILNLIVYKKGSESRYKQMVKKADGAGQYFSGVVSGRGRNLVFELPSTQYDRTPGKDFFLRQFLEEEAAVSCRPTYVLVDQLTQVEPTGEESESAEDQETEQIAAAEGSAGDETVADDPQLETDSSTQLESEPDADVNAEPASDTDPGSRPEVSTVEAIAERRRAKNEQIASKLHDSLEDLRPLLNRVVQLHPGTEDDLVDAMSNIVDQIRQQQFVEARQAIADISHALNALSKQPP